MRCFPIYFTDINILIIVARALSSALQMVPHAPSQNNKNVRFRHTHTKVRLTILTAVVKGMAYACVRACVTW